MATHLPQNQFISNSAHVPEADEAAASSTPPLPDAAAALSDGAFCDIEPSLLVLKAGVSSVTEAVALSVRTVAASDIMHIEHNAITQAIEVRPHNELEQLIGVAGKKRRPPALPRFSPDREAIWNAMFNPNAPRALASDPVWADDAPLFLRDA